MSAATIEPPAKPKEGLLDSLSELTKDVFAPKGSAKPAPKEEAEPPAAEETPSKAATTDVLPDLPDAEPPKPAAEHDDTPANLTEKAKADWKGLRESRRKAEELRQKTDEENAALKKKIAELEGAQTTAELEELRKTVKDYEDRLTVLALERHPKFQKYFDDLTNPLIAIAKSIGGEKLAGILTLPDGELKKNAIREAYIDLDEVEKSRFGGVLNDFQKLQAQRSDALSNSREAASALESQRIAQSKQENEQNNRVLDEVLTRWSDKAKGFMVMQTREGDNEWNAGVEKRKAAASQIFNGRMTVQDMARASAWAAAGPELANQLSGAARKIAAMEKEISDLKSASPSLGSGGTGGDDADDSGMSFMQKFSKEVGRR